MFVELHKSRLRFVRKHRGPLVGALAAAILAVGILLRLAGWELCGGIVARRSPADRERVRLRRVMFRAAAAWVLRACPLDAPAPAGRAA
jgi:hypothetical protein